MSSPPGEQGVSTALEDRKSPEGPAGAFVTGLVETKATEAETAGGGLNPAAVTFKPLKKEKKSSSQKEKEEEDTTATLKEWDNEAVLEGIIRSQIEYFFSDYHLANDTYLVARLTESDGHWIPISLLCASPRIKALTARDDRVLRALQRSVFLEVNDANTLVRRPNVTLPRAKTHKDLRRTVFVYGIPAKKNSDEMMRMLFDCYGAIKSIHLQTDADSESPEKNVSDLIAKRKFTLYTEAGDKEPEHGTSGSGPALVRSLFAHPVPNPNGDVADFTHLSSCFIVFSSQSQATKCVKARSKAVDGIRAMHKYDYCKIEKRLRTATLKGEALSLSPTQTPLIGSVSEMDSSFTAATRLSLSGIPPPSSGLSRAASAITASPKHHASHRQMRERVMGISMGRGRIKREGKAKRPPMATHLMSDAALVTGSPKMSTSMHIPPPTSLRHSKSEVVSSSTRRLHAGGRVVGDLRDRRQYKIMRDQLGSDFSPHMYSPAAGYQIPAHIEADFMRALAAESFVDPYVGYDCFYPPHTTGTAPFYDYPNPDMDAFPGAYPSPFLTSEMSPGLLDTPTRSVRVRAVNSRISPAPGCVEAVGKTMIVTKTSLTTPPLAVTQAAVVSPLQQALDAAPYMPLAKILDEGGNQSVKKHEETTKEEITGEDTKAPATLLSLMGDKSATTKVAA